jgi:GTP-binding protein YchF
MQIGLIGLQNSGKTTLYNTVAFSSSESNRTVVKVPDDRLDKLTQLFNPKKQINAILEIIDIPGLQLSDEGKVKITNDFLSKVKNNDALFHIVRQFENEAVPHPEGNVDVLRDIQFLETEFLLADMTLIENRIEKIQKEILKTKNEQVQREFPIFKKLQEHVEKEIPLRDLELDDSEKKILSGYQFLTLKPLLIGINFDENSKDSVEEIVNKVKAVFSNTNYQIIPFFGQFEFELSQLPDEESSIFMSDFGIEESAFTRILRTLYQLLGLQSFFTVGDDECRAWTIKINMTAQDSAGVIHSDFYSKFIRAEVVHYDSYMQYGSFAKCKEAGVWRLEGKDYIVKDGDILNIRHS